jgi:hypothetical protein
MQKPKDIWHFARPVLARQYLAQFDVGLIAARALFAKRRMGKSQFLERDLIPEAQRAGYLTTYLNLWQAQATPTQALIAAISQSVERKGLARIIKRLKGLKRIKASAALKGLAEGKLEAEWAGIEPEVATPLLVDLLHELPANRRVLLLLDEAQVLARKEHTDLAHSLRANLDSRKQSIKVMFAGSSEVTLRQMFGRVNEPFYNWAPLEPFPLLGEAFVHALTELVNGLSRYPLKESEAMQAFEALKRTPEFFRRFLNRYLAYASEGSAAALADTRRHVFDNETFHSIWSELQALDRAILTLLAEGVTDLFSQSVRLQLGRSLPIKVPSIGLVQKAVGRLIQRDVLIRLERGVYSFQDDAFLEWLKQR